MKINGIDVDATLKKVEAVLSGAKGLSPAIRSMVELLVLLIILLVNHLNLNSSNSSKPPSSDPNRKKVRKAKEDKKAGGQKDRMGVTLQKVNEPDKIEVIRLDRRKLPPGNHKEVGYESRQVFYIDISRIVTEYQAEILEDSNREWRKRRGWIMRSTSLNFSQGIDKKRQVPPYVL